MLVGLTPEQLELERSAHALMAQLASPEAVRSALRAEVGDVGGWGRVADLGLIGMAVPEALGGLGGNCVDRGVVLEETGRTLYTGPYLSTAVLGVELLLAIGEPTSTGDLLEAAAQGDLRLAVAYQESLGSGRSVGRTWSPVPAVEMPAEKGPDGWRLTGHKDAVLDGGSADVFLVLARSPSGIGLFSVDAKAAGLDRNPYATLDQTRKQARLTFDRTPASLIGPQAGAEPALARMLLQATAATTLEQVGGAHVALDMALCHATDRQQFGRPIGSFQAVQHACADMLLDVEMARSAAWYAMHALATDADDAAEAISIAKSFCSEAFRQVTERTLQILGGIGLTWEHPLHLYLKRARASELMFGSPRQHRRLLAGGLGI